LEILTIRPEIGYKQFEEEKRNFNKALRNKKKALRNLKKEIRNRSYKVERGEIKFKGVYAKYPSSQKYALKDINLVIPAGQKVGVVGRTGAGKSSFIKLLWRGLKAKKGEITVDDVVIDAIGLKEYRTQLTVIAQTPSLFEGTIASNISQTPMKPKEIQKIKEKMLEIGFSRTKLEKKNLSFKVETEGANLSQSEKQIICLMQSIRKKKKIVILDEATAYVDKKIEKKFQKMMDERFEGSTVFLVAHRISNILDCDRILVFDSGRIVEDGSVEELLANKQGMFYSMVQAGAE
jgi:ABC-type multidrug transport system fused ATPase/permease subunit